MKDRWDKFKIATEGMKNIKWLFPILLTLVLGSGVTNIGQFVSGLGQKADNDKAIHEVAMGFQKAMIEIEPKVVKSTCSPCGSYLNNHLRELH